MRGSTQLKKKEKEESSKLQAAVTFTLLCDILSTDD
jgi:hypothetical protein